MSMQKGETAQMAIERLEKERDNLKQTMLLILKEVSGKTFEENVRWRVTNALLGIPAPSEADLRNAEFFKLVVPHHLWPTGARFSEHSDCKICDWLEANTDLVEGSQRKV